MDRLIPIYNRLRAYFESGNTLPIKSRRALLHNIKNAVKQNEDSIAEALSKDLGKSPFESYLTETGLVYRAIDEAIRNIEKWAKPKKMPGTLSLFPSKSFIYPEPLGVVLIISPWNYPFLLTMEPLIGAVAAGCCALIKPSASSPATAEIMKRIVNNSLKGSAELVESGEGVSQKVLEFKWDHIFFTGSTETGKIVMAAAAKNLTPVTLEMGGKSPVIVHKDANIQIAARRIAWGKILNAGQTCVAPDYLFVHSDIESTFINALVDEFRKMLGNEPLRNENYPRIINEKHFERLTGYLLENEPVYGGQADEVTLKIAPTIIQLSGYDSKIMQEEIFGPLLPVISYNDISVPVNYIRSRPKALALYLFTEDKDVQNLVLSNVSFGGGAINDTVIQIAAKCLPFGGVGESGMGRYHGKYSFDTFTHYKSVIKRASWIEFNLRFQPYKNNMLNIIKRFL